MMIEFAWVSYWFPNAGTGAFCEYLNAVYIGGNKQKQNELFMKERKLLQQGRVGSNEFSQEKKYKPRGKICSSNSKKMPLEIFPQGSLKVPKMDFFIKLIFEV